MNVNRAKYEPIAWGIADRYGIPRSVLSGVITVESNWDPNAVGPTNDLGIAQFIPGTAEQYGLTDRLDPIASIDAAARFLADNFKRFGNWGQAIAGYNAGPGGAAQGRGLQYRDRVFATMSPSERIRLGTGVTQDQADAIAKGGKGASDAITDVAGRSQATDFLTRLMVNFRGALTFAGFGLAAVFLIIFGLLRLTNA